MLNTCLANLFHLVISLIFQQRSKTLSHSNWIYLYPFQANLKLSLRLRSVSKQLGTEHLNIVICAEFCSCKILDT